MRPGPVLRYPGAKWGLAPWIISHFPPHEAYVEPFFGSGAVLLRKAPSRSELVNDIDGNVVAFFRVLRDRPEDLARAIALTPYAREELHAARRGDPDDDLEKRRRGSETLIYADPPYLGRTLADGRTAQQFRLYLHEMTVEDHAELLDALDRHPGPVVLSGYPSDLYAARLAHWTTVVRSSRNQVNERRTEVLWLNDVAARQARLPLELVEVPA